MNYVFERRLCAAGRPPACRPASPPGARLPVAAGSTISSAPTRSACPRQADVALDRAWRSATGAAARPRFDRYRQALPRPLGGRRGSSWQAGGSGSPSRCRRPLAVERSLFLSAHRSTRSPFRAAEHVAQRRPADRRDRRPAGEARAPRRSRACSRSAPGRRPRLRRACRGRGARRRATPVASGATDSVRSRRPARRPSCSLWPARCSAGCCSTSCPASSRSSASRR